MRSAGADLTLDLRMESVSEGVLVSGTVKAVDGNRVTIEAEASQGENRIVRNAEVELEL